MPKLFLITLVFLFVLPAHSHQFKFFKISENLQERMNIINNGRDRRLPPIPGTDNRTLHQKLLNYLRPRYRSMGKEARDAIWKHNQDFKLGPYNYEGLAWERPIGIFNVGINREVKPHPRMRGKFQVHDVFTVGVGAITYLKYLKKIGAIDISMKNLALFTGLGFQRTFRSIHNANSYAEGLRKKITRLFFTFMYFKPHRLLELDAHEELHKEDYIGFDGGFIVESPQLYQMKAQVGIFKGIGYQRKVIVKASGEKRNPYAEFVNARVESSTIKSTGVFVDLIADLFNLYKITLVSFNLNYETSKTKAETFSVQQKDKELLSKRNKKGITYKGMKKALGLGKPSKEFVARFQTNQVWSNEIEKNTRNFMVKMGTVRTVGQKRNYSLGLTGEKTDFELSSEKTTYTKTLWKDIANNIVTILNKIEFLKQYRTYINMLKRVNIDLDPNDYIVNDKIEIEYEDGSDEPLNKATGNYAKSDGLKVKFEHLGSYQNANKFLDFYHRKKALKFLRNFAYYDDDILKGVEAKEIRGPMITTSKMEINSVGIQRLTTLSIDQAKEKIRVFCAESGNFITRSLCRSSLKRKFKKFKKEIHPRKGLEVMSFENLLRGVQRYGTFRSFEMLFGEDDLTFTGELDAKTDRKRSFKSSFRKEGRTIINFPKALPIQI